VSLPSLSKGTRIEIDILSGVSIMKRKLILSAIILALLTFSPLLLAQSTTADEHRIIEPITVNGQSATGVLVVKNGTTQTYGCDYPQPYVTAQSERGWACYEEATGMWLLHAQPPSDIAAVAPQQPQESPTVIYSEPNPVYIPYAYGYPYAPYGFYGYPNYWGAPFGLGFAFNFGHGFHDGHGFHGGHGFAHGGFNNGVHGFAHTGPAFGHGGGFHGGGGGFHGGGGGFHGGGGGGHMGGMGGGRR
jgi:hypothetical protein